eukprot:640138-Amorphochlora_amoeboformis.AAC.2
MSSVGRCGRLLTKERLGFLRLSTAQSGLIACTDPTRVTRPLGYDARLKPSILTVLLQLLHRQA